MTESATTAIIEAAAREAMARPHNKGDVAAAIIAALDEAGFAVEPVDADKQTDLFLIWSNKHMAWWRPKRSGYTNSHQDAGQYNRDEAIRICRSVRGGWRLGAPPPEIPVRAIDAMLAAEKEQS